MNAQTQFTAATGIIASNLCDYEAEFTLEGDAAEIDGFMGFNIRIDNGDAWADLVWFPFGNAHLSRDVAVAVFGAAEVARIEALASERYSEAHQ